MLRKNYDGYLERNVADLKEKGLHKKTAQKDKPGGSEHTPAGLMYLEMSRETDLCQLIFSV